MRIDTTFVVTCEHGGNEVPSEFADLFVSKHARRCLQSHRGYDPGALLTSQQFAAALNVALISSSTTRLLIDLNRSQEASDLYSEFSRDLSDEQKQALIQDYYLPYRRRVLAKLQDIVSAGGRAIHLSIHTFTSRYRGETRKVDVGLLFDPARRPEADFCEQWRTRLSVDNPNLRVILNEPYPGVADGLTTDCRKLFPPEQYLGIEVEISNRYSKQSPEALHRIGERILKGLMG